MDQWDLKAEALLRCCGKNCQFDARAVAAELRNLNREYAALEIEQTKLIEEIEALKHDNSRLIDICVVELNERVRGK
jgi:hypothetical protein